ncbi:hypothetical protein Q032_00904 [Pseudomonas aeruginosa BWHPSA019]|nr:hypothetical protein Q064_03798 [Pseudomonas aeruginosa BL10]ERW35365.1 hypothetical protein Q032_00904 [Pseudomonas aeruginosa BWHPSA019]
MLELGAGFNMEYTGRENIIFNAMLLGLGEQEISERLDEIIQFSDIGEFIDRPVRTYSSGMFVRLAFSIAAYVDADVLIVDEALAVGDAAFQFKCLNRLEELLLKGITILLVSHDIQLIKSYCSRAIYLSKGRVIFDGDCETATELYLRDSIETQRAEVRSGSLIASGEHGNSVIAYGNGQGRFLSIRMGVLDEARDYFDSGERVWVEVLVQFDLPVPEHPKITLTIRDQRGYNLYGINNLLLGKALNVEPDGRLRTRISFDCDLQAGEYALTFRLENSLSESVCELMDKKVNAAIFRVFNSPKCFDAVVNLHGAFEPVPFCCETRATQ